MFGVLDPIRVRVGATDSDFLALLRAHGHIERVSSHNARHALAALDGLLAEVVLHRLHGGDLLVEDVVQLLLDVTPRLRVHVAFICTALLLLLETF